MNFKGIKSVETLIKMSNLAPLDQNYEIEDGFLSNPGDLLAFMIKPEVKRLIELSSILSRKVKESQVLLSGLMTEESDKFNGYSEKLKEDPDFKQKDDVMNSSITEVINNIVENVTRLNEFYESRSKMSNHGHSKTLCKECNTVIAQCRCNDPNKEIKYEVCDKCKNKNDKEGHNENQ